MRMRNYIRQIVLELMRWTGLIRLFQFIHRKQIVILMIHGVMDDRDGPTWRPLRPRLSADKFDEYLRVLSRRYHFVSLMDAVDMLQGRRPIQPYSIVLTFDDGYRNNVTHALPILRRYNAPATFFVPTGFVNVPRPFWFDRLDYALQQVPVDGRQVKIGSFSMRLEGKTRVRLCECYKRLRRTAKKLHMPDDEFLRDMEQLAAQLEAESGRALSDIQQDDDWSAILTWEQIRQIAEDGVTIGSHTVDHIRLDLVGQDVAKDQLVRSRRDIETRTGESCRYLCYPNGSLSDETTSLARKCGYTCGLTTEEGGNFVGDNVMELRRIAIPMNARSTDLLARVSGVLTMWGSARPG